MKRTRNYLSSSCVLFFGVLFWIRTVFGETAGDEQLAIGPMKHVLFLNSFEETPFQKIPYITDEVLSREKILEQDPSPFKESKLGVYEPVERADKPGKEVLNHGICVVYTYEEEG